MNFQYSERCKEATEHRDRHPAHPLAKKPWWNGAISLSHQSVKSSKAYLGRATCSTRRHSDLVLREVQRSHRAQGQAPSTSPCEETVVEWSHLLDSTVCQKQQGVPWECDSICNKT